MSDNLPRNIKMKAEFLILFKLFINSFAYVSCKELKTINNWWFL